MSLRDGMGVYLRVGSGSIMRSERAAAAVTALLLLHHGEWCAWHVLAVTGRLVGAGEAAVAAWSRSRERTGAEPPVGGVLYVGAKGQYGTFLSGKYLVFCIVHVLSDDTSWASTPGVHS